jgi:RHS repeat-associated protein
MSAAQKLTTWEALRTPGISLQKSRAANENAVQALDDARENSRLGISVFTYASLRACEPAIDGIAAAKSEAQRKVAPEPGITGKEEDVEVGLQYFGKRYLNPLLGRWVSADPLAVHAPGDADLNVYAYVSGAVLKNVDPLGLDKSEQTKAVEASYDTAKAAYNEAKATLNANVSSYNQAADQLEGAGSTSEMRALAGDHRAKANAASSSLAELEKAWAFQEKRYTSWMASFARLDSAARDTTDANFRKWFNEKLAQIGFEGYLVESSLHGFLSDVGKMSKDYTGFGFAAYAAAKHVKTEKHGGTLPQWEEHRSRDFGVGVAAIGSALGEAADGAVKARAAGGTVHARPALQSGLPGGGSPERGSTNATGSATVGRLAPTPAQHKSAADLGRRIRLNLSIRRVTADACSGGSACTAPSAPPPEKGKP